MISKLAFGAMATLLWLVVPIIFKVLRVVTIWGGYPKGIFALNRFRGGVLALSPCSSIHTSPCLLVLLRLIVVVSVWLLIHFGVGDLTKGRPYF